jgi:hypothetical protein
VAWEECLNGATGCRETGVLNTIHYLSLILYLGMNRISVLKNVINSRKDQLPLNLKKFQTRCVLDSSESESRSSRPDHHVEAKHFSPDL